ncbi:hypothetical protein ACS0TY_010137 [Phlomoides rotata]
MVEMRKFQRRKKGMRKTQKSPVRSPALGSGTPRRFFKLPPSPAKHIKAVLARRHSSVKPAISEGKEVPESACLDKSFGFPKKFYDKYVVGKEVQVTTAIAIEDVRKETGHSNLIQFYDAYEDHDNVYIVMELCEEVDAKTVMLQILNVVAFCHLQGVVHRDLKPENFLFTTKEENSLLKAISDFVKPDERLNDIVGSAYYVAPEVLHRAYSTEADHISCRPFWARTESGIFRAVVKAEPTYEEQPWPILSSDAKDFVKRLLNKDPRKRMSAAQAPLQFDLLQVIHGSEILIDVKVPLDILIFRLMKAYMRSSPLRKAALRLNALQYRRMDFEEFCAAALSVYQLEALDRWEQHARCAYEIFDKDGNRTIMIEELASELGLGPSVPVHAVLHDWIRHTDGKLSFLGYVKLLHDSSQMGCGMIIHDDKGELWPVVRLLLLEFFV